MIACLDLEGVLVPEIWINVAERTGIAALRRTTRDEPDYDKLMRGRIAILDEHKLGLPDIQAVIATMDPLDGALDFLDWLREPDAGDHPLRHVRRVRGAADAQARLADALLPRASRWSRRAASPATGCASTTASAGPSRRCARSNFRVVAAGDSYNDTTMLEAADAGILFRPPENVIADFPQFPVTTHVRRAARGAGGGLGRRARPLTRRHGRKIAGRPRPSRQATNDAITHSVLSP